MGPKRAAVTYPRRRWWQLTEQWRMLGVFEINPEHEFYSLTRVMKDGLQASIQAKTGPVQDALTESDFKKEDVKMLEGFEMHTFAAPVFAKLRRSVDITEEEFLQSLCSSACFLQFVSNSKSKADFFLTNDKRFFLKTQSEREIRFLLSHLRAYVDHLEEHPHSLLVKFLGVHKIVIPNQLKKYFIVMQSVFYPDERITHRYDIKGCEVGRWTDPDSAGNQNILRVLKDNNFRGQSILLGEEKLWFTRQIKADAAFLQELNVLDYSLLLAHQPLHHDEQQRQHTLADVVLRTTKSLDLDERPSDSEPSRVPLLLNQTDTASGSAEQAAAHGLSFQDPKICSKEARADVELQDFKEHHRRLLPNYKNAVHVIDGPDQRYFVGVVDIFTVYGMKKRLENLWKTLRFPGREFSTVRPAKYSQRFCQWIQDHTQ